MAKSKDTSSVRPLDYAAFLDAHRQSEKKHGGPPPKMPRNRYGNKPPNSSLKKKAAKENGNGEVGPPRTMTHGVHSKWVLNRYANPSTAEGKSLKAVMNAIEKDIGKPFDARQSLLMSLIRSKVVIIMQIGKYLESKEEIIDYDQGKVPYVVDRTFFHASASLRQALNELYNGKNANAMGKRTYDEIVKEMQKEGK